MIDRSSKRNQNRTGNERAQKNRSQPASYVSETNYFEDSWQESFWGSNYPRLKTIKQKYDPTGLFFVHHGVGTENWSADGFTRKS